MLRLNAQTQQQWAHGSPDLHHKVTRAFPAMRLLYWHGAPRGVNDFQLLW